MASFPGTAVSFVQLANGTVTDASQMNVAYNEIEAIQNVLLGNTAGTIHIGGTALACTFGVIGQANVTQGIFRGYSTQTEALILIEDSAAAQILGIYNNPADDNTYVHIRSTGASKDATIVFHDEGNQKWISGKSTDNDFIVYDSVQTLYALVIETKGATTLSSSTDLGKQLLALKQNDADQAFIDFDGTTAANADNNLSTLTGGNTIQGFVKVEIEGSPYWMPYYDAPTE